MFMDDETWSVVKNTPHVINFRWGRTTPGLRSGSWSRQANAPEPCEVKRIFKRTEEQKPVVKVDMAPGR
jgi:transcriptional antiterminator NusG